MAVWSKVLPLTASCLSPLSRFESHLGLGSGFHRVLRFLPPELQLASHNLAAIYTAENFTKTKFQKITQKMAVHHNAEHLFIATS